MEPRGCPWRRGAARAAPWAPGPCWERPQALDSPYGSTAGPGDPSAQAPGMPVLQYPYGDAAAGAASLGPAPLQEDPWAPCAAYRMRPCFPAHGNPGVSNCHPSWIPPCPPAHNSKDSAYEEPEQPEREPPALAHAAPKVQYSAQPHMYGARKPPESPQETAGRAGAPSPTNPAAVPPEIRRIRHVAEQAEQLEQEVDEFVGKKTEKCYRLLEEMLTKLLLELDSVETGGQDSVRQARKEAVHRIQATLEKLERKGL